MKQLLVLLSLLGLMSCKISDSPKSRYLKTKTFTRTTAVNADHPISGTWLDEDGGKYVFKNHVFGGDIPSALTCLYTPSGHFEYEHINTYTKFDLTTKRFFLHYTGVAVRYPNPLGGEIIETKSFESVGLKPIKVLSGIWSLSDDKKSLLLIL